jgi:hypothetical protein
MGRPYLEVTYCKGKPFAAYLYLDRRSGDNAARSERRDDFVVDFFQTMVGPLVWNLSD